MSGQITFILWRESIEALLVISILASWLRREGASRRAAWFLWGGVAAGIAVAVVFALAVLGFSEVLPAGLRQDMLTVMVFFAAALIVQMVLWMRAHGRTLKRNLESGLRAAAEHDHWWAVLALAALAVAREGSETVVFLYGTIAAAQGASLAGVLGSIALGVLASLATFAALQAGSRLLPWRGFFRFSEVALLLLGCALFVTGVGDLVSAGLLPFEQPLWDTSWILDDGGRIGGLVASLTGYRAMPDAVTLGAWIVYWVGVALALRWQSSRLDAQTVA